ncbi:glycerophosphodiester phosphodiesterase family protein [uncultured Cellulomonas sp.]|uniref:glycerophosphodiester phosphodiesterase n=1 Tax=uncultured Cellulomonas sp. TaxID=189682 RepID=UPI00262FFB0E|nr:glycerophosphodiester phosphodiesterase family protein [uncultured Cellulomonas sp.]
MHRTTDPLVIAHRGDSQSFRENTVAAVEAAVIAGADAIEVDVQLAADGTLVAVHDDTFERLWGDPRPVAAMTWDDISRLGAGEQRVPRLAELLEVSRSSGIPLVLDQKHPVAAMAAARLVDRMHMPSTAFCGSTEGLVAIRSARPDATIYLNDASLQPPDIRLLAAVRPQFYNPMWTLLSAGTVHAMRTFDIGLCCWTPNDDAELALVLDLGVDAVMTDRPHRLRTMLEERRAVPASGARTGAPAAAARRGDLTVAAGARV